MSNAFLTVSKPGNLSLLQDFGRYGLSHLGINTAGAVDEYAYSWANHLLDNPINSPVLEITLGQAEFIIHHSCQLAIAGGDLAAKLSGQPLTNWSVFTAQAGDRLTFALPRNGLRAYLSVRGGFHVSKQLGSVSTACRQSLGGLQHNGMALQTGEQIHFSPHSIEKSRRQVTFRFLPNYNLPLKLRVIESYQFQQFNPSSLDTFYQGKFLVSQHADRMGYRLNGPKVISPTRPLLSEGIALGSIQIPPDGQPIILLNDRQTLGGYPKIGCVARIDLPRLAQAKPGQMVQFVRGDLAGLQQVWCQWAKFFGY
ncbi:biotin-dependent carboxyltransferase family protein [Vibrio cincinnatiensis]|uniref:5-oxoprolinase subunit C family protein n=1 Tax=Vibrio cincinnatiensis TaxID=675 RepID=UPI001EDD6C1C|nr:biotin-dependent carboxyltransferase family protein [Vibrio cincinnatiensis]MCG3728322.1 biotin-dependent carboxyltransferase [Vibrio cincinnatiensis]